MVRECCRFFQIVRQYWGFIPPKLTLNLSLRLLTIIAYHSLTELCPSLIHTFSYSHVSMGLGIWGKPKFHVSIGRGDFYNF